MSRYLHETQDEADGNCNFMIHEKFDCEKAWFHVSYQIRYKKHLKRSPSGLYRGIYIPSKTHAGTGGNCNFMIRENMNKFDFIGEAWFQTQRQVSMRNWVSDMNLSLQHKSNKKKHDVDRKLRQTYLITAEIFGICAQTHEFWLCL